MVNSCPLYNVRSRKLMEVLEDVAVNLILGW